MRLSCLLLPLLVAAVASSAESYPPALQLLHQAPVVLDQSRLLSFPLSLHQGCAHTVASWVWLWRSSRMTAAEQALWSTNAVQAASMFGEGPRLQPAVLLNVAPHPDRLFFTIKMGESNVHQGFFAKTAFRYHEWMHVAVTMTGTHMQAFVNGELQGMLPLSQFAMEFDDDDDSCDSSEHSENVVLQLGTLHRGRALPSIMQHTIYSRSAMKSAEVKNLMQELRPLSISNGVLGKLGIPTSQRHTTPIPLEGNPWRERQLALCPSQLCGSVCLDDTRAFNRPATNTQPHTATWSEACRDLSYQLGHDIVNSAQSAHTDHITRLDESHPYFMLSVLCADDLATKPNSGGLPPAPPPAAAVLAFRHHSDVLSNIEWERLPLSFERLSQMVGDEHELPFAATDHLQQSEQHVASNNLTNPECEVAASYYHSLAQYTSAHYGRPGVGYVDEVLLRENNFEGFGGEDDGAVQYHQQEAESGDVSSQVWLGKRYFWGGGGVQPNPHRAQHYFEQAAQQHHPEALYNLGVMLMNGDVGQPDPAASLRYFEQAASSGFPAAQNGLASQYLNGRGAVQQDLTKAFEYFSSAATNGSADGHYGLAIMYKDGLGVEQSIPQAVKHLTVAANAHHVRAMSMLGSAVFDEQSWLASYRRSALNTFSVLFEADELIELEMEMEYDDEDEETTRVPLLQRSCETALQLLKAASDIGPWAVLPARDGLQHYLSGDVKASLAAYERAADAGVPFAQDNAAFLHDLLGNRECRWLHNHAKRECVRTHKSAFLRRNIQLANVGDVRALRVLGDELSSGKWLRQDKPAAILAYAIAAELGDNEALFNVARAYHVGATGDRDLSLAALLYDALVQLEAEEFSLVQLYNAEGFELIPSGTYGVAPALMLRWLRAEQWWGRWKRWLDLKWTASETTTPKTTKPATTRSFRVDMESMLLSCCIAAFLALGVWRLARLARRRRQVVRQHIFAERAASMRI